ncbi:hypothetical protein BSKO_01466 [Bryopsis sp. KO-2023]|nr:hypothetical protein BSKO_01466 [Bryopsis sp. KO-2023]
MQSHGLGRRLATTAMYGLGAFWGVGVVAKLSLNAVKAVEVRRARERKQFCSRCVGAKTSQCQVCLGEGVLDYRSFVKAPAELLCVCPLCKGNGEQKCANCLGVGVAVRSS